MGIYRHIQIPGNRSITIDASNIFLAAQYRVHVTGNLSCTVNTHDIAGIALDIQSQITVDISLIAANIDTGSLIRALGIIQDHRCILSRKINSRVPDPMHPGSSSATAVLFRQLDCNVLQPHLIGSLVFNTKHKTFASTIDHDIPGAESTAHFVSYTNDITIIVGLDIDRACFKIRSIRTIQTILDTIDLAAITLQLHRDISSFKRRYLTGNAADIGDPHDLSAGAGRSDIQIFKVIAAAGIIINAKSFTAAAAAGCYFHILHHHGTVATVLHPGNTAAISTVAHRNINLIVSGITAALLYSNACIIFAGTAAAPDRHCYRTGLDMTGITSLAKMRINSNAISSAAAAGRSGSDVHCQRITDDDLPIFINTQTAVMTTVADSDVNSRRIDPDHRIRPCYDAMIIKRCMSSGIIDRQCRIGCKIDLRPVISANTVRIQTSVIAAADIDPKSTAADIHYYTGAITADSRISRRQITRHITGKSVILHISNSLSADIIRSCRIMVHSCRSPHTAAKSC